MSENDPREPSDVALVYAPTEDGAGARVLRARNGSIEAGEVRPAKEGQAVNRGELVRLKPRPETPCFCDVEVLYKAPGADAKAADAQPAPSESMTGPAQVATERYRDNWDRTFGPARRRSAPN